MPAVKNTIKIKSQDGRVEMSPGGDLVASSVETLRSGMEKALKDAKSEVVLDLSSTQQIDSLGITLVLGLFKECQKAGIAFSIRGASRDLMRVFRLFNLGKFFPILEQENPETAPVPASVPAQGGRP